MSDLYLCQYRWQREGEWLNAGHAVSEESAIKYISKPADAHERRVCKLIPMRAVTTTKLVESV